MELIGRCFLVIALLTFAIRWAFKRLAEFNPEAAQNLRTRAGDKAINVINKILK